MKRVVYTIFTFLLSFSQVRAKGNSMDNNLILTNSNDLNSDLIYAHSSHTSHASHASHMSQVFSIPKNYQFNSNETNLLVSTIIEQEPIIKFLEYHKIQDTESLWSRHQAKIVSLNSFGKSTFNKPMDCIYVSIHFLADGWIQNEPHHCNGNGYERMINIYIPISSTEEYIYIHYFRPFNGHKIVAKFTGIQKIIDSIVENFYEK